MDFLKKLTADKSYGFYVTISISVFSVITGIIYNVVYGGSRDYNLFANICLYLCLIPLVLAFIKPTAKISHYILYGIILLAFLGYVQGVYLYVSEVFVGIDEHEFSPRFILCTILFAITLIGGTANCFLRQEKAKEVAKNEQE